MGHSWPNHYVTLCINRIKEIVTFSYFSLNRSSISVVKQTVEIINSFISYSHLFLKQENNFSILLLELFTTGCY